MNKLKTHLSNTAYTANNALTNKSTLDLFLDLFSEIGNPLNDNHVDEYVNSIDMCYQQDFEKTIRLLAYGRDIIEGTGRRDRFMYGYTHLINKFGNPELLANVLVKMINSGISYWKDAFNLYKSTTNVAFKNELVNIVVSELSILNDANSSSVVNFDINLMKNLCKWMPRKGEIFNKVMRKMELTPKELRKLLVNNTNVVEQKMCAKDWDAIDFSKIPGRAMSMYNGTFRKRDETKSRYSEYLTNVSAGKANMNVATTVNAHEAFFQNEEFAQAAFTTMKEKLAKTDKKILVVSDTSGSMTGTPMKVSIALSILFGSLLTGPFRNCCIPFSDIARFISWTDGATIRQIIKAVQTGEVANTDLQAVFDLILTTAIKHKVTQEDMPDFLLIISDMQFDHAVDFNGYGRNASIDNIDLMKKKFSDAGYTIPQIIFWNVAEQSYGNKPITKDERGIMVSGFSQNIWKSIAEGENLELYNPAQFMEEVLSKERYNLI